MGKMKALVTVCAPTPSSMHAYFFGIARFPVGSGKPRGLWRVCVDMPQIDKAGVTTVATIHFQDDEGELYLLDQEFEIVVGATKVLDVRPASTE